MIKIDIHPHIFNLNFVPVAGGIRLKMINSEHLQRRNNSWAAPTPPVQESAPAGGIIMLYLVVLLNLWLSRLLFKGVISGIGELLLALLGLLAVYLCCEKGWQFHRFWQLTALLLFIIIFLLFEGLWLLS